MTIVLASVTFALWFIHFSGIPAKLKLPAKPFRCDVCLPVWLSLGLYWLPSWVPEMILIAFGSGILAVPVRNVVLNIFRKQTINA